MNNPFKRGDRVVSLGDSWSPAGSQGVIDSIADKNTVVVQWLQFPAKLRRYDSGVKLMHKIDNLQLEDEGTPNPNLAFIRRRNA